MKHFFLPFFIACVQLAAAQNYLTCLNIPDSLKQNANAIVRWDQTDIDIHSQRNMDIRKKRVVTVLNETGMAAIDAYEPYDKRTHVRSIEATVYDAFGNEIKKIKKKDFRDQCILDGVTLFSDNRVVYLDYIPTQYPFTIVYECEVQTSNTAQIPRWRPMGHYFVSVEKSLLQVTCPQELGLKKQEHNFSNFNIKKIVEKDTQLSYEASGLLAQKEEYFSVNYNKIFPWALLGLEKFNLEGVDGTAKTWKEFGKWYAESLLSDTEELPDATIAKVKTLVGAESDPIKKAKIIYNYVQQKSRYVSIQVGIGGFKPMLAKDVDRLGYGDCKALTNYTKALLGAVGVPSYHTVLYGDHDKIDMESEFISVQGNHMILCVPSDTEYYWLECTSQDVPFGYQANFTDDRKVLVIKPEGGEIVKTQNYRDESNTQFCNGTYKLTTDGTFSAKIQMDSEGSQYGPKYHLEHRRPNEQEAYYKAFLSHINNLKISKMTFSNDKESARFTEKLDLDAIQYATITGNKMLFPINAFNRYDGNIKRIRNRKTDFEIQRGSYDKDEVIVELPTGFTVESLPENVQYDSKFGQYKTEILKKDESTLIYKRTFLLKKGYYQHNEYEAFRLYMEQIAKNDNAKIILNKI
ncbi:DUF3857 domain-containing protein [Flavobacterium sp. CYK-4]|uniref:DUF3857 domain-containing protein n=1 Tax=Flavobacterium lotistagni TaxID=2709660 RepID=UPI00140E855B|nr:DUF3857 domain-containing protein [Flavobacterium lotistagni]NHM08104.1 DUF3857 domain-containing protein [Flavobacterium lotistagni]